MPSPFATFSLKKPYGLCPLWTRHIFHLLQDTLLKYWVTGWKVLFPGRVWASCHTRVTCCGCQIRPEFQTRGNCNWTGTFRARGDPSSHWLGRAGCCLFQENPRRAATVIVFPTDHQFCHTGALSRFFNVAVTCLTEYWFKKRNRRIVVLLILSPEYIAVTLKT